MGGTAVIAAWWFTRADAVSAWALRHGYFTTTPVFPMPGADPAGSGPTLAAAAALLSVVAAVVGAAVTVVRLLEPTVLQRIYERRPLPPVAAPMIALSGGTLGALTLLGVPFAPDYVAVAVAAVAAAAIGDWSSGLLRKRRTEAHYLNEIERTLLPYLGYEALPKHRVVAFSEWEPQTDGRPALPKTIMLAYTGRREELEANHLSRRLDEAVGAHYSLHYSSVDQLIAATVARAEPESSIVQHLRQQITTSGLFGDGATITDVEYSVNDEPLRFTVHHKIAAQLAATNRPRVIERKLDALLPGSWRAASWDHVTATAVFERSRELPARVFPPIVPARTSVEQACAAYHDTAIPLAVDNDGIVITWPLARDAHNLIVGPTGSGKTASMHSSIVSAARLGCRIFVIDFTAGEFTSYRSYPNVVAVVTEPYEAVALISVLYKEMTVRYNLYKRNRNALGGKEPILIVLDELTEIRAAVERFYGATRQPGDPADCPSLTMLTALLRKGGVCRMHCHASVQRPDRSFLEGEANETFTNRLSLGKLSPQAAKLIHGNDFAGRTVPPGIRQRGTALNPVTGRHIEVQTFYTPDPANPNGAAEVEVLADLKPALSLYDRGVIVPPDTDPASQPFRYYQQLPLIKAADHPEYDPLSPRYKPPQWLQAEDLGVDGVFGSIPGRDTTAAAKPRPARELIAVYEGHLTDSRLVPVVDLGIGDYVCNPITGRWSLLVDKPALPHAGPATLRLRDVHNGRIEEVRVPEGRVQVRDINETHLATESI
ncbi:FtsK/SpoIIIE domain-containing protein [Mycolicibacterium sp. XJ870]